MMASILLTSVVVLMSFLFITKTPASGSQNVITMSTTTSTEASGLLDVLLPAFERDSGIRVKVIAKGTGAAIRDGIDGNVDIIFVHAKEREEKFILDGYGTKRYAVMHNDFVLLGPENDPAGIKGSKRVVEALQIIAASGSLFVSRGDDSGTHTKEQALWRSTGVPLQKGRETINKKGKEVYITFTYPVGLGKWYLSIGQGMGKTLTFADEKQAYTLADRGTYIKFKYGSDMPIALVVLSEGDELLNNPYGIIPVSAVKHPHVKLKEANSFAEWIVSPRGQKIIASFKLLGKQLFFPDVLP